MEPQAQAQATDVADERMRENVIAALRTMHSF